MTTKKHEVPEELLSGLLANYKKPEDLIGENGLLKQLTKLLVEKALDAELTEHLGHDRHESVANANGNTRNGKSKKTLKGEFGELFDLRAEAADAVDEVQRAIADDLVRKKRERERASGTPSATATRR